MIQRPFWIKKINKAWYKRSIIWLSGVRRVGKTSIAKMLKDAIYLNCDLPSVIRKLEDPEYFLKSIDTKRKLILDEIHRLDDPSTILKIAADEYPELKILATGSSTLEATKKFKDTLTGRKTTLYLPPVLWNECLDDFSIQNLDIRLQRGGLPEVLLDDIHDESFFSEWIDSFYARDIQELFSIRNRSGFIKLMHLLFRSSGNLMEITQLSKMSGLTRPTVMSYLEAMRIANMIFLLPPFHGGGRREIIHRPKCYCFDTGIVNFIKGWNEIREEDRGLLWEHLVLDMLRVKLLDHQLYYWRDKSGREIDLVIKRSANTADIIECKINSDQFDPSHFIHFRNIYPNGRNFCFSPKVTEVYKQRKQGMEINFIGSVEAI